MIRSQSTAAAALNSRLEEDMEAIRQVVVIILFAVSDYILYPPGWHLEDWTGVEHGPGHNHQHWNNCHHYQLPHHQSVTVGIAGGSNAVLNFCANNYLGLSNHPDVVEAGVLCIFPEHVVVYLPLGIKPLYDVFLHMTWYIWKELLRCAAMVQESLLSGVFLSNSYFFLFF